MTRQRYPFEPKTNAHLEPGQFWAVPLSDGRFACGRVLAVPRASDSVIPVGSRMFLAGLHRWVGEAPPTGEGIAGAELLAQGFAHIRTIRENGRDVLGLRPLDLDGVGPPRWRSHVAGGDVWNYEGAIRLHRATAADASLPIMSTWGFKVISVIAEHALVAGNEWPDRGPARTDTGEEVSVGQFVRTLSAEAFAQESGATREVIDRLIEVGAIERLPDGQFDSRDEIVASTVGAMLDAGIPLDDLAWALSSGRFGIRSLGLIFSEPRPRSAERYADLAASLGDAAAILPAVYAALGMPEPEPDDHPRIDEVEIVLGFVRLWSSVDPTGEANVRVARQVGDGTRRIAEVWLDIWDEVARPDPTTQGAPTVGSHGRPADPASPEQNLSIPMAELGRRLVSLVHERHVETTLNSRIVNAIEHVLRESGHLPAQAMRPPAIAFVDLAGFTTLTEQHGDEAAARAAAGLLERAEVSGRREDGRVVKELGDGVLMRFPDAERALRAVRDLVAGMADAGLPAVHAGIAAGPVVVRDGDVFGRTVNLASRIADLAGPGEVVVEEGVVVALPRGTAAFEPVGRVELKGIAEPVALWRVKNAS